MTTKDKIIEETLNDIRFNWDKEGMDEPNDMSADENRNAVYDWFMEFEVPKVINKIIQSRKQKIIEEIEKFRKLRLYRSKSCQLLLKQLEKSLGEKEK